MKVGSRVAWILIVFFLPNAKCFVASSILLTTAAVGSNGESGTRRIVSIRKNGGESKIFEWGHEKNKNEDNDRSSTSKDLWSWSRQVWNWVSLQQKVKSALRSTFLPSGYPSRTPPGYLRYCMFSWTQDMTTQLRSVLATQRVLEGVGVGREGATALSALMNYLVRDGCGMAATLLFTSAASTQFRTDVKRWRLFADLMVDLGITLEVMAVLVPRPLFLPMISVGNMCKAMCGVAAGACGGSINLHWAKGSDISDINAKFGAQHTVTGALGLVFAAFFARSVDHVNTAVLWTLYASLTIIHILANVGCMRLIAFDSCNTARMNMLLNEFFDWWQLHPGEEDPGLPHLSSPQQIAMKEPLFFGWKRPSRQATSQYIRVGVSFDEYWQVCGGSADMERLRRLETTKDNYLLAASPNTENTSRIIPVVLLSHVTGRQEAKAYFHAYWLGRISQETTNTTSTVDDDQNLNRAWNMFEKSASLSGWDLSKTELSTAGYEVDFVP